MSARHMTVPPSEQSVTASADLPEHEMISVSCRLYCRKRARWLARAAMPRTRRSPSPSQTASWASRCGASAHRSALLRRSTHVGQHCLTDRRPCWSTRQSSAAMSWPQRSQRTFVTFPSPTGRFGGGSTAS